MNRLAHFRMVLLTAAVCSIGVTSAQTAIDNVEDLYRAAREGGEYSLAPGQYVLDEALVIGAPFQLTGGGVANTLLIVDGTPVGIGLGEDVDVRIAGMSIVGAIQGGDIMHALAGRLELADCALSNAERAELTRDSNTFTFGTALYVTRATRVTVDNCAFIENGLTAIEAGDTAVVEVRNSFFDTNAYGVYAEDEVAITLVENQFRNSYGNALQFRGSVRAVVEGNVFDNNGTYHPNPDARADGMRFLGDATVWFHANVVRNSPAAALAIEEGSYVDSRGNLFEANGGYYEDSELIFHAVFLDDAAELVMLEDRIVDNPGGAFEVYGQARLELTGVLLEANASWAHTYVVEEGELQVSGSYFRGNEGTMYLAGSARADIVGSEFTGSADHGLEATGDATVSIVDSEFSGNALVGIGFYENGGGALTGSTLSGNGTGLVVQSQRTPLLDGNTFTDNGTDVGP